MKPEPLAQLRTIHQNLGSIGRVEAGKEIIPMSEARKQVIKRMLTQK